MLFVKEKKNDRGRATYSSKQSVLKSGLPLFTTGCEIQGLFHDFPGPFHANPRSALSIKA